VYHGHFKCNLRRIVDYTNLHGYLLDLYQQPGIEETVNIDHIKRHYYYTHDDINPTRIVPIGPILDLKAAHGRDRLRATLRPGRMARVSDSAARESLSTPDERDGKAPALFPAKIIMRFANQVALVTGAGRGIGHAIALRLASEGARVAVVSRTEQNAQRTAEEINAKVCRACGRVRCDAANFTAGKATGGTSARGLHSDRHPRKTTPALLATDCPCG
jgi:hypothetical protein